MFSSAFFALIFSFSTSLRFCLSVTSRALSRPASTNF